MNLKELGLYGVGDHDGAGDRFGRDPQFNQDLLMTSKTIHAPNRNRSLGFRASDSLWIAQKANPRRFLAAYSSSSL
jgi:hypothetical protein